jgi:hypothetical protein
MTDPVELPLDLDAIEIPEELTLAVLWKRGDGDYAGGEVRLTSAVTAHLQSACLETIERIAGRELRPYTPDMNLENEEALVASGPEQTADSPLAEILLPTAPLALVSAQSLPRRSLQAYAALVQSNQGEIAFVRKTNPRTPAKAGRMYALLGNSLARIGGPVFALDDYFDMIVTEAGIVSLDQSYFELLFRDTPALQMRIPEWVQVIEQCIPLGGDGAALLAERARTDGRLRRRLRSIAERGHLASVTIERVREHIREAGLDEDRFLDGDTLRYDEDSPFDLVYLLNEDFFQGGLTDAAFRSDRKSPR